MEQYVFTDRVKECFRYLVNEYGFSVVGEGYDPQAFGNSWVQYQSSTTDILIVLDRGQVLIETGPCSDSPANRFGLTTVVEFLVPEADEPAYIFPKKWDNYYEMIDWQVTRLARILRQYCVPVLRGEFSGWKGLERFEKEKVEAEYKAFTGKDLPKKGTC